MGLLGALRLHPVINDPPVYYPIFGRQTNQKQVFVDKYRTFGGFELIEPGLTIALYPAHTGYNLGGSSPSSYASTTSFANFEPYTLGEPSDLSYQDKGNLRFICQIYYRDSNFDISYNVTYGFDDIESLDQVYQSFGDLFSTPEDNRSYLELWEGATKDVTFSILPGEEVIRDYCYLVRSVLREIGTLSPFGIRGFKVRSVDYPSSDWVKNNANIVFHTAYITIDVEIYETVNAKNPFYTSPVWGNQDTTSTLNQYRSYLEGGDSNVSGLVKETDFDDRLTDARPKFQSISTLNLILRSTN
jgi:hypothetical protein